MDRFSRGRMLVKMVLENKNYRLNSNIENCQDLSKSRNEKQLEAIFDPGYIISSPSLDGPLTPLEPNPKYQSNEEHSKPNNIRAHSNENSDEDNCFCTDSDSEYCPSNSLSISTTSSGTTRTTNPVECEVINSRKRRNEKNWRRNQIKRLRNSGEEYVNWSNKLTPKRELKPPCLPNCRLNCSFKFKEDARKTIFHQFWALSDINRQRDFIKQYVEITFKKRERLRHSKENRESGSSRRNLSYFYFLPNVTAGFKIKVCQRMFLNTLSISHQMVKTVAEKSFDKKQAVVEKDMRGSQGCENSRLPIKVKETIRAHINSIDKVDSHYCRESSTKQYLPSSLNLTKLYNLYKEYCLVQGIVNCAKFCTYRQVFNTEFNLAFHIPKKDQCDLCNKFKNSNLEEKNEMQELIDMHLKTKALSRQKKENEKKQAENSKVFCVAAYDLQKVLITPKAEISQLYYKRKLSTYNLTVYDIGRRQGYCHMWHEGIAARGASEVGSSVLSFIKSKVEEGFKKFSFYTDNCAGQNRNRYMFCMYMMCVAKYSIEITHNFFEPGHTQNEGDSVHSVIERTARNIPVFSPSEWYNIARLSCKVKPYIVKEMYKDDIFDLKTLLTDCTKNWKKDDMGEDVMWNKVKVIEIHPSDPYNIVYQYAYDGQRKCVNTLLRKRGEIISLKNYSLKPLREVELPISEAKFKDLQQLCETKVIPEIYHPFYQSLSKA